MKRFAEFIDVVVVAARGCLRLAGAACDVDGCVVGAGLNFLFARVVARVGLDFFFSACVVAFRVVADFLMGLANFFVRVG